MYNGMHMKKGLSLPVVHGFMVLEYFDHSILWREGEGVKLSNQMLAWFPPACFPHLDNELGSK